MPRSPRLVTPGLPHHVTQRGVDRMNIFVATEDRLHFLECLDAACRRHTCALHAYVLMTNHIHLLVTPPTAEALSLTMRSLGTRYARYFNATSRRSGPLFEGRYRASAVDEPRHLLACYRYIELNPVRAGMAAAPADFTWSSHRCNALAGADPLVTPHPIFDALGDDQRGRSAAYRALFDATLTPDVLRTLRGATRRNGATGGPSDRARTMDLRDFAGRV